MWTIAPITRMSKEKKYGTKLLDQLCYFRSFDIQDFLHFLGIKKFKLSYLLGGLNSWPNFNTESQAEVSAIIRLNSFTRGGSMVEQLYPRTNDRPGN